MAPRIELLFWDGCPSHPRALSDLRAALADTGLDPGAITLTEVRDDAVAPPVGRGEVERGRVRADAQGHGVAPSGAVAARRRASRRSSGSGTGETRPSRRR